MAHPPSGEHYVVGVDFGTLSGRAVVVAGRRRRRARHRRPRVPARRDGATAAGHRGTALPPDWALQVPADYLDVLRDAVPAAVAAAGIDPAQVIGIATDFTACTMLPTLADGTPLCEVAGVRRPAARLREAVEAPRRPAAGRPDQRAGRRARRAVAAALRRADLLGVGVRQGPAAARGGPARSTTGPTAGSRRPTGSCGSCAARTSATPAPPATRASARTARTRRADYLAALHPGFAGFVADKLDAPDRPARRPGRRAHRRGRRLDRAARGHRGRGRQRRRPRHRPGRAGRRARPDGRDHGHLDLPRDERRRARRGARHVRRRRRRHRRRACGATRPARAASATSSAGSSTPRARRVRRRGRGARAMTLHEHLTELAAAQAVGEHGLVALDWHSGNRSVLVDHELSGVIVGPDAGHPARGRLPRAARGDRLRHPRHRRDVRDSRRAGRRSSSSPAGCSRTRLLMQIYADVTRLPLSVIGSEQGPALGSAIHAAVAAGAYPDVPPAAQAMGKVAARRLRARRGARRGVRRALRRVPRAARPLRPRRQRRHAPAEGDPARRRRAPVVRRACDCRARLPRRCRHDGRQ